MFPLLLLAMSPAADPPKSPTDTSKGDEAIHKYLAAEVKRLSDRFMDGAKTKAEWEAKRPKLKEQFLDMVGLWPLPEKTPLKATVTGTLDRGDVTIEKLHFQSKPGLYVTGNLYRPKKVDKRLPAILYVCGHTNKGRDGNKTAFQDHGLWFASNGYVCLIVDTLQLGEVAGKHHGTYNLGRFWWQDRGYTPAGVECWNGIRAIDYLQSRPDVDPERIGVTGISGGGATTVWMAAADDRVKVAIPVSGMSDLESYVTNQVINGHCDCMFFINTYQWEWTTALALFAPKPLLFTNSDHDTIFPMDGNRRIIERLRKCYTLLGKPENVDEYVSKGGHDYRPDLRIAVFSFLNKHLNPGERSGVSRPIKDADFPKIDGKDLRVFPEDKDLPKDQINDRIDELFVPKAEVKLPKAEEFNEWKAGLVKKLRETSFRALPEKVPAAKNVLEWQGVPFLMGSDDAEGLHSSEEGLVFSEWPHGSLERPTSKTWTLVLLNPEDDWDARDRKRWEKWPGYTFGATAIQPRGGPRTRWSQKNPPNTVERSLALLGQTADTGRVRDVASELTSLHKPYPAELRKSLADLLRVPLDQAPKGGEPVRLLARGHAGIFGAYATLFIPGSVAELVILDPPTSHRDGPHFLNVDRVLDLPTALGLLAPDVKLTLINAKDPAFDKTAAIYKLAGAADKFERK